MGILFKFLNNLRLLQKVQGQIKIRCQRAHETNSTINKMTTINPSKTSSISSRDPNREQHSNKIVNNSNSNRTEGIRIISKTIMMKNTTMMSTMERRTMIKDITGEEEETRLSIGLSRGLSKRRKKVGEVFLKIWDLVEKKLQKVSSVLSFQKSDSYKFVSNRISYKYAFGVLGFWGFGEIGRAHV